MCSPEKSGRVVDREAAVFSIFVRRAGRERVCRGGESCVLFSIIRGCCKGEAKPENAVVTVVPGIEVYLQLKDLIDVEKETARVQKEQEKVSKEIDRLNKKLSNQGFLAKAPAAVVEKEKEKLAGYTEKMAALTKRMEDLAKL